MGSTKLWSQTSGKTETRLQVCYIVSYNYILNDYILSLTCRVRSIPLLVVVSRSGQLVSCHHLLSLLYSPSLLPSLPQLDDNAKKTVEGAGSAAAAIKLFSKWLEKSGEKSSDVFEDEEEVKQKKTILGSIKKALSREVVDKDEEVNYVTRT